MPKARFGSDNPMYGRPHSPESVAAMAAARKGKAIGNQNARKYASNAERNKAYYERHREKIRARVNAQRRCPEFMAREIVSKRKSHLQKRYGITTAEYEALFVAQGHKCAICGAADPGSNKSKYFDVDHCHSTGKVRSLLCRNCNVTVGVVEKKADLLKKIDAYLAKHRDQK